MIKENIHFSYFWELWKKWHCWGYFKQIKKMISDFYAPMYRENINMWDIVHNVKNKNFELGAICCEKA